MLSGTEALDLGPCSLGRNEGNLTGAHSYNLSIPFMLCIQPWNDGTLSQGKGVRYGTGSCKH